MPSKSIEPKILLFDVETSPVPAWIFRPGPKVNISHKQLMKGYKFDIICIAYKWANNSKIYSLDWGLIKQNSARMIQTFSKVIENSDIAIAHNGDNFDVKQINTQRLLHNQAPIAWPTTEDTLKQIRKHFYFPAYNLDYLAKILTGAGKDKMDIEDWTTVVEGKDPKALAKMIKYCKRDVQSLYNVWARVVPHCQAKAHAGLITGAGRDTCPRCASNKRHKQGYKVLASGRYQRYSCQSCGHKWRDTRQS